jgi:hypothetical protein
MAVKIPYTGIGNLTSVITLTVLPHSNVSVMIVPTPQSIYVKKPTEMIQMTPTVPVMEERPAIPIMVDIVLAMSVRFLCVNGPTEMIQMTPTVPVMKERHAMTRMVDIVLPSLAPRDLVIFIQSPGLII